MVIGSDPQRTIAFCQELVRIESTPGQERAVVERVAQEMRDLGYSSVRIDEAGNAVGRLGPEGPPGLLIDGHVDTIPLHNREAWSHDPLAGDIVDGMLFGLGSVDMKGAVAAAVVGVGVLAQEGFVPATPIEVVASIAEEMMEGATLRHTLAKSGRPRVVVIAEPTSLRLATAQRGRAKVRVEIAGRSCHASNPERGVNAVEYMARIVAALPQVPGRSHPILGSRSLSVIDIASEPYPSVSTIPNRSLARFDCRFLPGDSKQDVLELIAGLTRDWPAPPDGPTVDVTFDPAEFTTYVGERYRVDEFAAPWETDRRSPLSQRAAAALQEAGLAGELGHYHFCTNGSLTGGELGIPTLGFGPGDQHRAHVVDESVRVDDLAAAARGYYHLARTLSEAAV